MFLNGDCGSAALSFCAKTAHDKVIAVDGGLRHCLSLGLTADVLIGDLDSAATSDVEKLDAERTAVVRFPVSKDATDMQLALEYLLNAGFSRVTLAGISGGRTDQMLCNWLLLGQARWKFSIDIIDDSGLGFVLAGGTTRSLSVRPGATVSLLPLSATAGGVSTGGLHYPLKDADLQLGSSLGISNVAGEHNSVAEAAEISITLVEGVLLVFVNHGP